MNEPTMTMSEANAKAQSEGPESNLTFVRADNGLFLVRNHGISDDGENLNIEIIARVIPDVEIKISELSQSANAGNQRLTHEG